VASRAVVNQVVKEKVAVLSSDAKVDPRFSESKSIIMTGIRSSMAVPLLHKSELLGVMMVDSQNPNAFGEKDLQLFTNIANQAALFIANAALAQRIEQEALARARFQRLLSPAIAELVVSGKVEVKQGGEPRVTTMLFTDIRGFTSRSETMRAEDIVADAQRLLRAHGGDRLSLRGHARQVRGRRDHGALRRAGVATPTTRARGACALAMLDELRASTPSARPRGTQLRDRRRHQHRRGGRGLHRQLEGHAVHRDRRAGEPRRAPVLGRQGHADPLSEHTLGLVQRPLRGARSSSPSRRRASPSR
jgi:class 3 adenylate cyclase